MYVFLNILFHGNKYTRIKRENRKKILERRIATERYLYNSSIISPPLERL